MDRVNVYRTYSDDPDPEVSYDPHVGYTGGPGQRELLGWFDYDKAEKFNEDKEWDGNNMVSVITGSQWDHEQLLRTSSGRWVLRTYSNRQGVMDDYYFMEDDQAREWFLRNRYDATAERFFGDVPDEEDRRPGRPPIGEPVHVRLGDLIGPLDAYASERGYSRAEAIRQLVAVGLNATTA